MASYGQQTLGTTGRTVQVSADGAPVRRTSVTLDWATVVAAVSDTTLADGTVVKTGQKGLEYGVVLCEITATGKYGPYKSDATDGRQTLARGKVVILNTTIKETPDALIAVATDFPDAIEGGVCWKARIKAGGAGQPTFANLETALPLLRYV